MLQSQETNNHLQPRPSGGAMIEKIDKLIEECAEVIHSACKVKKYGLENFHPDKPEINNLDALRHELDDLLQAMNDVDSAIQFYFFNRS
jgi:hypothetical protein